MRRMKLKQQPKLIGIKKKLDRREAVRERKALSAAHLERSIEKELIERLKSKAYGDAPLNVNENVWQAILDREKGVGGKSKTGEELENELDDMLDDETDEEDEDELEKEMDDEDDWGEREFVSDISGDEDEDGLSDLEDAQDNGEISESGSEDDDSDDQEEDKDQAKTALGKRKATSAPAPKPSRKRPEKKPKKGPRVEVEYEQETESVPLTRSALASW